MVRRRVGRAVAEERTKENAEAGGAQQYGLSEDGAGALYRAINAYAGRHKDAVVVSLDISKAFPTLDRKNPGGVRHARTGEERGAYQPESNMRRHQGQPGPTQPVKATTLGPPSCPQWS